MAMPVSDTYGVPSGTGVYAGNNPGGLLSGAVRLGDVFASGTLSGASISSLFGNAVLAYVTGSGSIGAANGLPNALLNLIAAAPANSWMKANLNTFESTWQPVDFRAPFGSGVSNPFATINCWASFGWDDINYRLILWGGGHANSNANEVYSWSALTQNWTLSFSAADVVGVASGTGSDAEILAAHLAAADQAGEMIAGLNAARPWVGVIVDAHLVHFRRVDTVEPVGHAGHFNGAAIPDGDGADNIPPAP